MFNVKRTKKAPKSLSNCKSYSGKDVFDLLKNDFHDKCYLCETKEPLDINVEHFVSHRDTNEELKYSWDNLYFSCSRCNNIKGKHFDNLIDCCDENINIYDMIKLLPPRTPYGKNVQIEAKVLNDQTKSTIELLNRIYNSDNSANKKISADYLRRKIFDRLSGLYKHILIWQSDDSLNSEKEIALERIKLYLRTSAPYSAFMREVISEDEKLKYLVNEILD